MHGVAVMERVAAAAAVAIGLRPAATDPLAAVIDLPVTLMGFLRVPLAPLLASFLLSTNLRSRKDLYSLIVGAARCRQTAGRPMPTKSLVRSCVTETARSPWMIIMAGIAIGASLTRVRSRGARRQDFKLHVYTRRGPYFPATRSSPSSLHQTT